MDFCSNGTEVKNSRDEVAKNNDTSAAQIRRYIRLNYLTEKLIDMVDRNILSFRPAVEISYLSQESQRIIESLIENQRIKVSLKQAEKLKELEKDTEVLNLDIILSVLTEKKRERKKLEIPISKVKAYFDDSITDEEMINIILNLLESNIQNWHNILKEEVKRMNNKKQNEKTTIWIDTDTMTEEELLENDTYLEEEK